MSKNPIALVGASVSEIVLSCLKDTYKDKEFGADVVGDVAQIYVLGRTNAAQRTNYDFFIAGVSAAYSIS